MSTLMATLIPTEIWSEILYRVASHREDVLQPPPETTVISIGTFLLFPEPPCAHIMRLALVCRQWYNISMPLLYKYIDLSSAESIKPIKRSLLAMARRGQQAASYTRRLNVRISCTTASDLEKTFEELSHILPHFPNLTTFFFRFRAPPGLSRIVFRNRPELVSSLLKSVSPSLEYIAWAEPVSTPYEVPCYIWRTFLNEHPRLTTMIPPLLELVKPKGEVSIPPLHAPSLSHVVSSMDWHTNAFPSPATLPNLHSMTFEESSRASAGIRCNRALTFFKTHGAKLRAFHWLSDFDPPGHPRETAFPLWLEALAESCPNLRQLSIVLVRWDEGVALGRALPSVMTLGVRLLTHGACSVGECRSMLATAIGARMGGLPNLKTLRLLGEVSDFYNHKKELAPELNEIRGLGIRIVDAFGLSTDSRLQ